MTPDNLTIALRAFHRRRPFRPFLIELVSGDRVRITHPEALAFRGEIIIYSSPQGAYRLFESNSVCQLLDVTA